MSHLFTIQGNIVNPKPEILLVMPFKEIWERDKDEQKILAKQEFAYIEFMISMMKSNPYRDYPANRKAEEIRKGIGLSLDWKADGMIQQGMAYIDEIQTEGSISYRYWIANKNVLEKQIDYFESLDPGDLNMKTGNPLYKPVDIPNAVEKAEKVLMVINNLKAKVDEELYETSKNKGGKEISPFANPNSI